MSIRDVPPQSSTPAEFGDRFYRWPAGPEMWRVCETCNRNEHRCHFCGDDLRHAETMRGPNLHQCYVDYTNPQPLLDPQTMKENTP